MNDANGKDPMDAFEEMTVPELRRAESRLRAEIERALSDRMRNIAEKNMGTPKDPAVQRLAGMMILQCLEGIEQPKGPMTYEELGAFIGVSRERVRMLYEKLQPAEYHARRKGGETS